MIPNRVARAVRLAGAFVVLVALFPAVRGGANAGIWLAGDLHVHTTHSHDVCGTPPDPAHCDGDGDGDPSEFYTWGFTPGEQIANAEARALDFLVLSDHNTVSQQRDPGYRSDRLLLVPGYENSLGGHAQMIGATKLYPGPEGTAADVQAIADALRNDPDDRGVFQINHPGDGGTGHGDWVEDYGYAPVPDTIEVWSIGAWHWQPPMPASNNNDEAIRFWQAFLDAGARVAATGGSDNHWRSTSAAQGVGQPTTWVYVTERSVRGVLEGLRAGRTTISHQPPGYAGPRAYLETTSGAMVGDTVARDSTFRVRVDGAAGAVVRVLGNGGGVLREAVASGPAFSETFTLPASYAGTYVRVEVLDPETRGQRGSACPAPFRAQSTYCDNRLTMLAMTSPVYLA